MNEHDVLSIGEKLRTARKNKDFSLRELAARAEVSPSLLSQIENGRSNPSVLTLYHIAGALDVPITFFFSNSNDKTPETQAAHMVRTDKTASELRSGEETMFQLPEISDIPPTVLQSAARVAIELRGGVRWERLTPTEENDMQFLEVQYEPGAVSGAAMSHHSGREFGMILEGELKLELGFEQYILKVGDSIIFNSNTPHRLSNETQTVMRAIWILWNRGA